MICARSRQPFLLFRGLVAFGLVAALMAGCGSGSTGSSTKALVGSPEGSSPSVVPVDTIGPSSAPIPSDQPISGAIPPGREIAEGGGGPVQYTFREEWRRTLAEAQKWRSGAYLINAVGNQVNDEGVPSWWMMVFIDRADADAVLRVEIDPWGKITRTEEVTGDGVTSFVNQYTKRIPYAIIDSDQAVTVGKAALGERYNLLKTKDPELVIGTSVLTGGAIDWTYMLFYTSTAAYVSAQLDALTGEVLPPPG